MRILFFLLGMTLVACTNSSLQSELETVQNELTTARETIAELSAPANETGELVHIVLFKVKPDADQAAFIAEIKKLAEIETVRKLEVGPYEDMGDARALSDYGVIMEMTFADKAAYESYQKHPIHLALKDNTMSFLAGPPATYDFVTK